MRPDTQQAGRRRRGGRRHRGPRTDGPRSQQSSQGSPSSSSASAKKAAKPGFFQRLLAFFTGGPKKSPEVPGNVYGRVLGKEETSSPANGHANGNGRREARTNDNEQSRKPASEPRPAKPARKPELTEVTSPKLYVGNLSFDASESDLGELFAGVGSVQNSEVVSHRETQKSKGFAFVTLATIDEAKRAVVELHDKEFMGRRLVVSGAKTNDVREVRDARNVE